MTNTRQRILMLNNEFPPLGGGTGSVTLALFREFAKAGDLEIVLVTSASGQEETTESFAPNITIYRLPVGSRNLHHATAPELLRYAWKARKKAMQLHQDQPFDLCLAWSTVPAGWVAQSMQRKVGLPYIVRVGGADIPGFEKRYRWLYPLLKPVIRYCWQKAERVIAKCDTERTMMQQCLPGISVEIIPNGVDTERFKPAAALPPFPPLRLVCVGRLIRRKRQADIIEAVDRLNQQGHETILDLVGTGDDEPRLRKRVRERGLEDRVIFSGYVPREKIAEHYRRAHLFVLASENEGMSVSTLEAMACGLPLVVSRTGGTDELVEEEVNGFTFAPRDRDALAQILWQLVKQPNRLAAMGDAACQKAANFTWPKAANSYTDLFNLISCRQTMLPSIAAGHRSRIGQSHKR